MPTSTRPSTWLSRPLLGIVTIVALVLLLEIPISLIRGLINDRVATRSQAISDVTTTWGGQQAIIGPRLVVPYRAPSGAEDGKQAGFASFLPASLSVDADVTAQALTRGLFTIPVYRSHVRLRGRFVDPDLQALGIDPEDAIWERASLVLEITEPKSVGGRSSASWDGERVELLPGTYGSGAERGGIHSPVSRPSEGSAGFDVVVELTGSNSISFVPFSRDTHVALMSNWSHPSFSGSWLPTRRTVDQGGFTAEWDVPFLGRDYPQAWTGDAPYDQVLESRFGVDLISPVDHYRMSERSTKYSPLFLFLTFGLLWLIDTLVGVRVHPIQYLLVGAAMCIFYLLELSLSEHIGFIAAYAVAGSSVVVLITAYTKAVLRSTGRGARMGAALGALYSCLLALLTLERYALLVGSLGLFLVLAMVMYLTRWIDWHDLSRTKQASAT